MVLGRVARDVAGQASQGRVDDARREGGRLGRVVLRKYAASGDRAGGHRAIGRQQCVRNISPGAGGETPASLPQFSAHNYVAAHVACAVGTTI